MRFNFFSFNKAFVAFGALLTSQLIHAVECGDTITTQVTLEEDLTCGNEAVVLTVVGPTGSLDLNGHTIDCVSQTSGVGVLLSGRAAFLSGGALENGIVSGCIVGVSAEGEGFHNIQGVNVIGGNLGIAVSSSNSSVFQSNVTGSESVGVGLESDNSIFINNTITGCPIGLALDECSSCLVSNNHVFQNFQFGIVVDGNTVNNLILQNRVELNGNENEMSAGILLGVNNVNGNIIAGNIAINNVGFDLYDSNDDACDGDNFWFGNTFDTANPSCLE
ncbi:hypothetical protein BTJ40_09175 [Microbulbifer sp. A4B17]|uniref:right-handed parallel beta-helix repeat-containing protein n=1 Tax=Microbulbifer sp. A4B17 TaxID=359370 RepID=UPI000D52DEE5|nr:right-handed parallel beta-helix repeat-containing protein [Microbulbifer sp. A4B17]AWF80968.1 hypothetical protein BTJ40_09175 [Microbulbifer sp. A4B17]